MSADKNKPDSPAGAGKPATKTVVGVPALPAEVPPVASFVTVSVGPAVRAFTVGAMPEAVMRMVPTGDPAQPPALPPVRAVATHSNA